MTPEAFWSRVQKTDGCWFWRGSRSSSGYGRVSTGNGHTTGAHRLAYTWAKGPVPEGLVLDHLCRIRHCVNPDHLEAVTDAENIRRSPFSPHRVTHCPSGHEYSGTNVRVMPRERRCRACARIRETRPVPCPTCSMVLQSGHMARHRRRRHSAEVAA